MTKNKAPSVMETINPLEIPQNAMQRSSARQKGIITVFMKNHKQSAHLKNKANLTKSKRMTRTSRPMTRTSPEESPIPTYINTVTITTTPTSITTVTITTTTDEYLSATSAGAASTATSKSHIS